MPMPLPLGKTLAPLPAQLKIGLSVIAVLLTLVSGWLGGELVNRLGVGVDEDAHLDATRSLSGQPARRP